MVQSPTQTSPQAVAQSVTLPYAMDCTVLTPGGSVVAKGKAAPRKPGHLAEAYSVLLTDIDPSGVLEAMVYSDQPEIILRTQADPKMLVRIDHITGPPQRREFFCQLR